MGFKVSQHRRHDVLAAFSRAKTKCKHNVFWGALQGAPQSLFVTKDTSFESADKSVVNTDHDDSFSITSLTKLSRLLDIIHYVNRIEKDCVNNERNDGVCAIMAEDDKVLSFLHVYMITRFTSFIRLYFYIDSGKI